VSVVQILFLTPDFVWPADNGGRLRTVSQLRVLSSLPQVDRIRLFFMCEEEIRFEQREALMREVAKLEMVDPVFHPVHLFRHRRYVPRVVWLRVARGVPYIAAKWDSPSVQKALRQELTSRPFDVVWLNGLGIARYLPLVRQLQPQARIVLDGHNVESNRFAEYARRQRGLRRRVADAEWRAALRFERDVLRAVDAVGAISHDDARAYGEIAGIEATFVPQVASLVRRNGDGTSVPRLCWIGNLTWESNVRGLDWFCGEVWPRVREGLPEATLEIVGSGLPTDERGVAIAPPTWRARGIATLGFVDDLTPVYERSVAMVAPILGGTGIRIKLLEAFRHGMPVVTTPAGAGGLPIEPGREAFVETDAASFAARVIELATSNASRARIRAAAYAFLEQHNRLAEAQAAVAALLGCGPTSGRHEEMSGLREAAPTTRSFAHAHAALAETRASIAER
jgi:glycosyltransferase involved in cell wall biosynthesis